MNISFMTVITINLSLSVLLIVLLPHLNCRFCLRNLGGRCLAACCIAVMVRALLPVEFPFSRTIPASRIIPSIRDMMLYSVAGGDSGVTVSHLLLFVWLTVALFLIGKKFWFYYQIQKTVRRLPDCNDDVILEIWQSIKEKYPSGKRVRVVRTELNTSPLITGLHRPVILLPEHEFSRSEYRMILEHEMLHCIRRDVIVKMAADILCVVYWWNPLFYVLRSRIFELIEIENDRQLTRSFSVDEKAVYMQCLTDTARKICSRPVPFALSFGKADQKALRRRIDVIGYGRTSGKAKEFAVMVMLFLVLWCSTSFTLEPFVMPEGTYVTIDETNCYIVQNGNSYEVYYQNKLSYTIDSIEYFDESIPVYTKDEKP